MLVTNRTLVPERVDALLQRCRRDIDEGSLPSCQVALALDGEIVVNEAFGEADTDTRYAVFSSTKPFIASVMWQLIAEGLVDPAQRVVEFLPEFGTNGKDVITVEQVMLHTSGFPAAPLGPPEWSTSAGRREVFARWRLNWAPGTAFEYHPTSAHWVLAEIIIEVTGRDYRDVLEERVTKPLGLPRVLGLHAREQHHIAILELSGEPASPDELEKTLGIRELPVTEVTDAALLSFNHQDNREVGVPGGGGIMRAADLAMFYQALMHNQEKLWDPSLLDDVTSRVRNTFPDPMTRTPANRALGVVVAGDDGLSHMRGMGHTVSPRAFGHNGAAGQIAWADPATGLSLGYCTNGIDANLIRQWRRGSAVASYAASCTTPI